MINQEKLRKKVKIAKACNDDMYYKDFAEYIEITENSFYNWLNGTFELANNKAQLLNDIISDLIYID